MYNAKMANGELQFLYRLTVEGALKLFLESKPSGAIPF